VLLPRYLKRRSHARKVDYVPAPLFPRYVFVSFDVNAVGWRVIRSTRGVIDLVRDNTAPIAVPTVIIEEVRMRQDNDGFVVLGKHLNLQRGSRIRIGDGPFINYEALFESFRDDNRVLVLLSLLGRSVYVDVPIRAVAPLE
jgi:transcriptional antiterminator RfaH